MEIKRYQAALEAVLFASGEPVSLERLAAALEVDVADAERLAEDLAQDYRTSEGGMTILRLDDSYQMCSKRDFAPYIRRAMEIRRNTPLSQAAMEVLAIVAYNQPVTRMYVDTLRRADSSYAMNNLIDRGLIECKGRMDVPGRPMLYGTTNDFLRCFGLNSLADLPGTSEELMALFAQGKNAPDKPEEEIEGGEQLEMEMNESIDAMAAKPAEEKTEEAHDEELSAEDDVIDYE